NAPTLIWGDKTWHIIAEAEVPFTKDVFWKDRWTKEVNLVIPPISSVEIIGDTETEIQDRFSDAHHNQDFLKSTPTRTIKRKLIPKRKNKDEELEELVESLESRVVYTPLVEKDIPFYYPKVSCISYVYSEYKPSCDALVISKDSEDDCQPRIRIQIIPSQSFGSWFPVTEKMKYAYQRLFKTLFKWCQNTAKGYQKRFHHDLLVPKEFYHETYQRIKSKYADSWVRNWPEKTDPTKFVFEDIAIASWLISLWELERKENGQDRPQSFVDLGCGNGLLTYLLSAEGHEGVGIDSRKRKIWDIFQEKGTNLKVETLQPNSVKFPNVDWLIGNHADELVPWIPIIAAKSSENTKFMVIPCCFYALSGVKYNFEKRITCGGKYKAYQEYIQEIIEKCGFVVEYDWLRIPSTKNVAMFQLQMMTME
ncbi:11159_t:CDS:10, partial [Acaulospora morrowiae]